MCRSDLLSALQILRGFLTATRGCAERRLRIRRWTGTRPQLVEGHAERGEDNGADDGDNYDLISLGELGCRLGLEWVSSDRCGQWVDWHRRGTHEGELVVVEVVNVFADMLWVCRAELGGCEERHNECEEFEVVREHRGGKGSE